MLSVPVKTVKRDRHPSLYEATVGDAATCRKLAERFYTRAGRDPVLRPFFPGKTHKCRIDEFAAFLTQFLGGPAEHTQKRWWLSLHESHQRFAIGPRERAAWMHNMRAALDEVDIADSARGALQRFFEQTSTYVINQKPQPEQPREPQRATNGLDDAFAERWQAQRLLDEAVAAIRIGAADRAIALAERAPLTAYLNDRPAVRAALLAEMIRHSDVTLLAYVRHSIEQTPTLACEQYSGRTLLHEAAITANAPLVQLLLELGASPTAGVHSPLYRVGNECQTPGAAPVVAALIKAGAPIDAHEGPKQCTALHMAARRDNVEVAAALLDYGANLEARDSTGDTPLRRAVNCNQPNVAAYLLSRGADPHSIGSKGLTPTRAARTATMKRILRQSR